MSYAINVGPHPIKGFSWVVIDNDTGQAYTSQVAADTADLARVAAEDFATRLHASPESYTFDPGASSE